MKLSASMSRIGKILVLKKIIKMMFINGPLDSTPVILSPELKKYIKQQMARASFLTAWLEPAIVVGALWSTPVEKRNQVVIFSALIGMTASMILQWLIYFSKWEKKFNYVLTLKQLTLLIWGCISAWLLKGNGISWTSFYILLTTIALASIQLFVFAPSIRRLVISHFFLLIPSYLSLLVFISGVYGQSMFLLLATYTMMLLAIGKKLNIEFWTEVVDRQRLKTIIESIPGMLGWFNRHYQLLGGNAKFNKLLTKVKKLEVKKFVKSVFEEDEGTVSKRFDIDGSNYFWVGQKYNMGSEVVVMGIDITKEQLWQDQLEQEREKISHSAYTLACGEIIPALAMAEPQTQSQALKYLSRSSESLVPLKGMLETFKSMYDKIHEESHIEWEMDDHDLDENIKVGHGLFLVLSILVENSMDAVKEQDVPVVGLDVELKADTVYLRVYDSGSGVEEFLEDIIFESTFTTKEDEGHGTGLALALEYAQNHGGQLKYFRRENLTNFELKLPL